MHLFNVLKGKFTGKELNPFRNWLNHASRPDTMTLTVVVAISRAIQKFLATYAESHLELEKFSQWALDCWHGWWNGPPECTFCRQYMKPSHVLTAPARSQLLTLPALRDPAGT
jgi:hypothetical protein